MWVVLNSDSAISGGEILGVKCCMNPGRREGRGAFVMCHLGVADLHFSEIPLCRNLHRGALCRGRLGRVKGKQPPFCR